MNLQQVVSEQPAPIAGDTVVPVLPTRLRTWRKVRENCEAVIVAIILALIIRHFSVEAFEIPTGSMAPGLNGVRVNATCPNCSTTDAIGIDTDNETNEIKSGDFRSGWIFDGACGECGAEFEQAFPPMQKGAPVLVDCPRCRKPQRPAHSEDFQQSKRRMGVQATCRACGHEYTEVFEPADCVGGHRILVNKFIYQLRDPRRWEVIVFKFNRQRNYIKRLVGLPGERIQVVDGDIYINGNIERKPAWAQDALWFQVSDSAVADKGFVREKPWHLGPGWTRQEMENGFRFAAAGSPAVLGYERRIANYYAYNAAKGSSYEGAESVRDLRLLVDLLVESGAGSIELQIINGEDYWSCILPIESSGIGPARFELRSPPQDGEAVRGAKTATLREIDGVFIRHGEAVTFDYYLADRQLTLRRNGEVIAEFPLPRDAVERPWDGGRASVQIIVRDAAGTMSRVRLFRDIHYTAGGPNYLYAVDSPFEIPGDGYFAMGDNSPYSLDSRAWGALNRQNLLGRALSIFWPAWPTRWEVGFIR